jgi:hypothetical protein
VAVGFLLFGEQWKFKMARAMEVGRTTLFEWLRNTTPPPADIDHRLVLTIRKEQEARRLVDAMLDAVVTELGRRTGLMGAKWSNAEYLLLQEILMGVPRPPSSEIAVEMGRPQGTIDAKISEMGMTQRALRPVPKDDYSKPEAGRIRRQRNCLGCRRSFFSEGNHNRMCTRCRIGPMTEIIGVYA